MNIPLFDCLSESARNVIRKNKITRTLEKGHTFFYTGERAHNWYWIEAGWVKLFRETVSGDELIIDILHHGDSFNAPQQLKQDLTTYSAQTLSECTITQLKLSLLQKTLTQETNFSLAFLEHAYLHQQKLYARIEHTHAQNSLQRLGCFILRLFHQTRSAHANNVTLPFDKTVLAAYLNMRPETLSRCFEKLSQEINLSVNGMEITLQSLPALSQLVCQQCSQLHSCRE